MIYAIAPGAPSFGGKLFRAFTCHKNEWHLPIVDGQGVEQLQTGPIRHLHVGNDEVGHIGAGRSEAGPGVHRREYLISGRTQNIVSQELTYIGAIVYDEYLKQPNTP